MVLESEPVPQRWLQGLALALGLLLMLLAHRAKLGDRNALAGFLLGALLAVLSAAALTVGESRRIEVDPRRRRVVLEVRRRWGAGRRLEVPFAEVEDVLLGFQGSRSDGTRYYDLVLRRRGGVETHLMGGCAFEGRLDRGRMDLLREELRGLLGLDEHGAHR